MRRVIFNNKGGVGKTSIACNLAAAFAEQGDRVLVVDLDAQANTTSYLSGEARPEYTETITDFFESTLSLQVFKRGLTSTIVKTSHNNIWLAPADSTLGDIQTKLESRFKILKLRQALDAVVKEFKFDQVIIDTPPAINFFSISGLLAAERVLIPFDCDMFSAEGLKNVVHLVEEMSEDHESNIEIEGVVINQFTKQAKLPTAMIEAVRGEGLKILSPYITSSIVMRESRSAFKPLLSHKPSHKLSRDFRELSAALRKDQ